MKTITLKNTIIHAFKKMLPPQLKTSNPQNIIQVKKDPASKITLNILWTNGTSLIKITTPALQDEIPETPALLPISDIPLTGNDKGHTTIQLTPIGTPDGNFQKTEISHFSTSNGEITEKATLTKNIPIHHPDPNLEDLEKSLASPRIKVPPFRTNLEDIRIFHTLLKHLAINKTATFQHGSYNGKNATLCTCDTNFGTVQLFSMDGNNDAIPLETIHTRSGFNKECEACLQKQKDDQERKAKAAKLKAAKDASIWITEPNRVQEPLVTEPNSPQAQEPEKQETNTKKDKDSPNTATKNKAILFIPNNLMQAFQTLHKQNLKSIKNKRPILSFIEVHKWQHKPNFNVATWSNGRTLIRTYFPVHEWKYTNWKGKPQDIHPANNIPENTLIPEITTDVLKIKAVEGGVTKIEITTSKDIEATFTILNDYGAEINSHSVKAENPGYFPKCDQVIPFTYQDLFIPENSSRTPRIHDLQAFTIISKFMAKIQRTNEEVFPIPTYFQFGATPQDPMMLTCKHEEITVQAITMPARTTQATTMWINDRNHNTDPQLKTIHEAIEFAAFCETKQREAEEFKTSWKTIATKIDNDTTDKTETDDTP
jgi:hypothetical protein